jgi:SNF2 family DNA or RNA helicase
MTAKLYPYQKKGVKLIGQKYKGRVLLGDSMGLGKTIQSAQYLAENPEARPAVIVCPAMLKWNWQEELLRHYNIPSTILEGRKPPKQKNLLRNEKIVILNYEILQAWMPWIERMKPQIAIVDEIHYCKNRKTIRTKSVRRLSRICPQFIGLSGTPIENKPAEIWPIANMIRPDKFDSFWTFAQRYCEPQKMHGRWVFNGSSNRGELRDLLKATIMIRRTKEQVAEQLPPKTHVVVPLPIDKPEEYYAAKSDLIHWLKRNSVTKANSATHAKMLASVGYLKRLAARLKTKNAMAWFDDLLDSNPGKIILFAIHKKIVQTLERLIHSRISPL